MRALKNNGEPISLIKANLKHFLSKTLKMRRLITVDSKAFKLGFYQLPTTICK
jgi:hypothetical protein